MNHNVSSHILPIQVKTIEGETITLAELLYQTTEEPILDSYFIVNVDEDGEPTLSRFSAWTQNYVLILVHTAHGDYLLKHERNP